MEDVTSTIALWRMGHDGGLLLALALICLRMLNNTKFKGTLETVLDTGLPPSSRCAAQDHPLLVALFFDTNLIALDISAVHPVDWSRDRWRSCLSSGCWRLHAQVWRLASCCTSVRKYTKHD
jgi:hypothetical protein